MMRYSSVTMPMNSHSVQAGARYISPSTAVTVAPRATGAQRRYAASNAAQQPRTVMDSIRHRHGRRTLRRGSKLSS